MSKKNSQETQKNVNINVEWMRFLNFWPKITLDVPLKSINYKVASYDVMFSELEK